MTAEKGQGGVGAERVEKSTAQVRAHDHIGSVGLDSAAGKETRSVGPFAPFDDVAQMTGRAGGEIECLQPAIAPDMHQGHDAYALIGHQRDHVIDGPLLGGFAEQAFNMAFRHRRGGGFF